MSKRVIIVPMVVILRCRQNPTIKRLQIDFWLIIIWKVYAMHLCSCRYKHVNRTTGEEHN